MWVSRRCSPSLAPWATKYRSSFANSGPNVGSRVIGGDRPPERCRHRTVPSDLALEDQVQLLGDVGPGQPGGVVDPGPFLNVTGHRIRR